jgi:hypothetical protein
MKEINNWEHSYQLDQIVLMKDEEAMMNIHWFEKRDWSLFNTLIFKTQINSSGLEETKSTGEEIEKLSLWWQIKKCNLETLFDQIAIIMKEEKRERIEREEMKK